jgi:hypothetical protein
LEEVILITVGTPGAIPGKGDTKPIDLTINACPLYFVRSIQKSQSKAQGAKLEKIKAIGARFVLLHSNCAWREIRPNTQTAVHRDRSAFAPKARASCKFMLVLQSSVIWVISR